MKKVCFAIALLLTSCGTKTLTPVAKKPDGSKDNPQKNCLPVPEQHVMTFRFNGAAPTLIAVKLGGESGYHFNECAPGPQNGLLVSVARPTTNVVAVTLDHNHIFTDGAGAVHLPATQVIEVFDMHACGAGAPTSVFKTGDQGVNIVWKVDYPNGTSCPARITGNVDTTVGDLE
jgi:hypothetical protein